MATVKLVILKAKQQTDGKFRVKVAVSQHGKTEYINTMYYVSDYSKFFEGKIKGDKLTTTKLDSVIEEYTDKLQALGDVSNYDAKQIKELLVKGKSNTKNTLAEAADEFLCYLKEQNRNRYYESIERCKRYFLECNGDLMLRDISTATIERFKQFLQSKKKANDTSIGTILSHLKSVINRSVKLGYVRYEIHPFALTKISKAPVRDIAISIDSMRMIMNYSSELKLNQMARDMFMLSFYLGGMNLIDLVSADLSGTEVTFVRSKTKNSTNGRIVTTLPIIPQAKEIIDRYIYNSRLSFGYDLSYRNFVIYIGKGMKKIVDELGITERCSLYSARNSFGQYCSDLGIPDFVTDYCLSHSDTNRGVSRYYSKVRVKQADVALRKVVDYVENPEKYKDIIEMRESFMFKV